MEKILQEIKAQAKETGVPILRDQSAQILCDLCKKNKPQRILEIGTATGYSAIVMLSSCEAKLITLEKDEERAKTALLNFSKAGLENRVRLIKGDAMDAIKAFYDQKETFDFIFLDGPKGQYVKYLPYLKAMLVKGGILFADDVLLHGWVKSNEKIAHKHRTMVMALRRFLEAVENDKDFETKLVEIEDGLSISTKL